MKIWEVERELNLLIGETYKMENDLDDAKVVSLVNRIRAARGNIGNAARRYEKAQRVCRGTRANSNNKNAPMLNECMYCTHKNTEMNLKRTRTLLSI